MNNADKGPLERRFLLLFAYICIPFLLVFLDQAALAQSVARLDRHAIVARHNPVITKADPLAPLSVGNGKFAFTVDVTGLQTFFEFHSHPMSIPLGTFSDWGWHSFPNPEGFRFEETLSEIESNGRKAPYPLNILKTDRGKHAWAWFQQNPHRLHLGRIALDLKTIDGARAAVADLTGIHQVLDLWTGTITSEFRFENQPVRVITRCHPSLDLVAVRIESPLVSAGRLSVRWVFPYGTGEFTGADWSKPDAHQTTIHQQSANRVDLRRQLDDEEYFVTATWRGDLSFRPSGKHEYLLSRNRPGPSQDVLEFVTAFSPHAIGSLATVAETAAASDGYWREFWMSGGAIDLSQSKDPRWKELERRIVLSQYLTAIQCAGLSPPQESGLTHNSWWGKFHLEMTTWHGVHFVLWGREQLLERWMNWITGTGLRAARERAKGQGYPGARWPKMTDARALWQSAGYAGPVRVTQQGHMIYLPELLYRAHPNRETLERYKDVVFETAEWMAAFAALDRQTGRYVLGPPILSGAEATPWATSRNPAVDLSYWAYGLTIAQKWRDRLGLPRNPRWDEVANNLSPLPTRDGCYVDTESHPDAVGRPALAEIFGCMPGINVDHTTMEHTLQRLTSDPTVVGKLQLWGTDYPMFAMTAGRLNKPDAAVNFLLENHPRNNYLANGHLIQRQDLTVYLPANGGLLWAVAMMVAGWDGAPKRNAPGFPDNGQWNVRWEGLRPAP